MDATVRKAVTKAARTLDRLKPGWWKRHRFSLRKLNIMSCHNCVLGQVFRKEAEKRSPNGDGFTYALLAYCIDGPRLSAVVDGIAVFASGVAEVAWRELIVRRRKRAA